MMDEEIYKEQILDHYKHPRNKGVMEDASFYSEGKNASCGDSVTLFVRLDDGVVSQVSFEGTGCAVSQASASLMTEKLVGKNIGALRLFSPGDVYDMLGIHISPGRVNCALLPYKALEEGLKKYHA